MFIFYFYKKEVNICKVALTQIYGVLSAAFLLCLSLRSLR